VSCRDRAPGVHHGDDTLEKLSTRLLKSSLIGIWIRGIILLCVAVAHIKKDSRLSPFGVIHNRLGNRRLAHL